MKQNCVVHISYSTHCDLNIYGVSGGTVNILEVVVGTIPLNKFILTCVQFSMGVEIQLFEVGAYRPYSFRFLSVGMDEKVSLQRKSKHKRRIGRSHYG
jgi:hypothetical protein